MSKSSPILKAKKMFARAREVRREKGMGYVAYHGLMKVVHPFRRARNNLYNEPDAYNRCYALYSVAYSRLFGLPLIRVVGDSHVWRFQRHRLFVVYHFGPVTAYNLNKKNSQTRSKEKLFRVIHRMNLRRDILLLVFGEIDCRIHIYYQYKKNSEKHTIPELIDRTIANYGEVLRQLRDMGVTFCVYGTPPAVKQENVFNYPFYAPPEARSQIYREFHERLKRHCEEQGYGYIDVYSRVRDERGFIREECYYSASDNAHLNEVVAVGVAKEWFVREGLVPHF